MSAQEHRLRSPHGKHPRGQSWLLRASRTCSTGQDHTRRRCFVAQLRRGKHGGSIKVAGCRAGREILKNGKSFAGANVAEKSGAASPVGRDHGFPRERQPVARTYASDRPMYGKYPELSRLMLLASRRSCRDPSCPRSFTAYSIGTRGEWRGAGPRKPDYPIPYSWQLSCVPSKPPK